MKNALAQADQAVEALRAERRDDYYPQFHLAPSAGWINDPNGLICIDGVYHAFYQHHPYDENWGPMHWGHATSRDLAHWQHQPIALAPGEDYDKDGCFSGCAVDDDGVLTLIYTGHVWLGKAGDDDRVREVQCLATSEDGVHFVKHGPVLTPPNGIQHFRDPKVWREDGEWWMVVGAKENGLGQARLYRSADLRDWRFDRLLGGAQALHQGYMWECPDFFPLGEKHLLLFSPQGLAAQGYRNRNRFQSGYLLGHWRPGHDFSPTQPFCELDAGHDFYAPQTFTAADGRRLLFAWMDMWESPMPSKAHRWAGALTLPRELTLGADGGVRMNPARELTALRREHRTLIPLKLRNQRRPLAEALQELQITLDLAGSDAERYGVAIGGAARLYVDNQAHRLVLERFSEEPGLCGCRSVALPAGERLPLRLFIDRSSLEVFVNQGEACLTSRIYPADGRCDLSLFAEGGQAQFGDMEGWRLESIWA
ncbi:glycoside hydrolase family 32 protein [Serratia entomophila]|uniref:glycoside hydrolase family 32 protein n=1 Tax=Serratia entomophila TaxID=42906 RepID=UPI002177D48E|nr:glycoside hydrolase family 32 protein [Serratia entomophila]CAI0746211.1 Sucrose-6-phosphate hydrolase [Serratia entomophila]CAI0833280.1 Sucrose-6-phosphate hydrolase [Serratia entomophila]CAI0833732.1 Sucrose-6-phosphate hydrolase [Serratia entomophila]CAI0835605.1 Sucrose-6-phosphate hydrolase [Serratia entomophila]CAI1557960.1 Sucrose-6-phosphate hydrolase [Serratia entomophila]